MQLVRLHKLIGNQVPSQWSSFMHILQPSTLFRRPVSKQVQQLPAQEYTNQQKTASGPLKHELQNTRLQASASANARVHQSARTVSDPPKHELQEHKLVIKQGSKQVQVQMQWIRLPNLSESSFQVSEASSCITIFWPKAKLYRFHAVESITVQA